jgi:maltose alpha-D-glucosyltransferase/alpha-amylase
MQTLGRRVGELHAALTEASDGSDFAPEPIVSADLSRWYSATHFEAEVILKMLEAAVPTLAEPTRGPVQQLLGLRERLFARIRELCSEPVQAQKIRFHGNLHLGKVLLVADDVLITGFEGDAALTLAERRRKDSPLHDVATLLRSLDYVRAASLDHALVVRTDVRERLEPALAEWLQAARAAVVKGYRKGVARATCVPRSERDQLRLIQLFEIARALREVRNELMTRPAWLAVPVGALLSAIS